MISNDAGHLRRLRSDRYPAGDQRLDGRSLGAARDDKWGDDAAGPEDRGSDQRLREDRIHICPRKGQRSQEQHTQSHDHVE